MNSKIEASLLSAKNENTVGLFNVNVDFSCVKVEIPKQYEDLGNALSSQRRDNAENGQHHKTARRLGAIFHGCIPDIEILSEAYGKRASEIARSSELPTDVSSRNYPQTPSGFGTEKAWLVHPVRAICKPCWA